MFNLIWVCIFSLSIGATTFDVQPIERQIQQSDGLFQGHFLRSKSIELENGQLATQMMFKMNKELGLQSELFGMDEVIVHYPGGSLKGKTVRVDGVPEFVPGEKVVLFIRNVQNRYWGMNLGFGSYKVINYGKETMLVNTLFPDHPKAGQVSLEKFEKTVKDLKGSGLRVVQTEFYPTISPSSSSDRSPASIPEGGQNRSVASTTQNTENEEGSTVNVIWLIALLGITGGVFRLTRFKTTR